MKNKLFLILLLSIVFSIQLYVQFSVNALDSTEVTENKKFDAVIIDDTIKNSLSINSEDTVVRIHNVPIVFAFSKYNNINELLRSDYIDQTFYAIVNGDTVSSIYTIDDLGETTKIENSFLSEDFKTISALLNNGVLDYLPEGTVVSNIYYFWGQSNHQGSALYYNTNKGGFVYYSGYMNRQYLFPEKDFFEYMKAVYSIMGTDNPPGSIDAESIWNLSNYDITSNSVGSNKSESGRKSFFFFGGIALVITAFLSVLIICIVSIVNKRKKVR